MIIYDHLSEQFPDYTENEIKSFYEKQQHSLKSYRHDPRKKSILWRKFHIDARGKHDTAYRRARKYRLEMFRNHLEVLCICPYCDATGNRNDLFTHDGICTACGMVPESAMPVYCDATYTQSSFVTTCYPQFTLPDRVLANVVSYDPRFYIKERLNNWRCVCPIIPNEHFKLIIMEILHEIGYSRGFSARLITRTVIYNVINRLFGSSPWKSKARIKEDRRFLVYRERWMYIKRWMCESTELFQITDAAEWTDRYYTYEPTDLLIQRLEQMLKVLEFSFRELLYAEKKDGLKRHNRPRRDVAVLYLLYGLHPGLCVIYGTDYWKPPTTPKSQQENTQRFRILVESARERDPMNYWPDMNEVDLELITNLQEVDVDFDSLPMDVYNLFPCHVFRNGLISRRDCELF